MRFERLRTSEHDLYLKAMELYHISFPIHEQREDSRQEALMGEGEYQFNLIFDEDKWIGILLCWETQYFIYVEHFCINPEMRNHNYGQRVLSLLNERRKCVILEIDPPVDEVSIRRKGFYERAGYRLNEYEHVHPPYRSGHDGHRLVLMSCPTRLTEEEYLRFDRYLQETVMRDCAGDKDK